MSDENLIFPCVGKSIFVLTKKHFSKLVTHFLLFEKEQHWAVMD